MEAIFRNIIHAGAKRIHGSKRGEGFQALPPPGKLKYQSNLDNKIIIKIWSPTPFPHSRQIKLSPRTLSWKKLGKLSGSEIDYF